MLLILKYLPYIKGQSLISFKDPRSHLRLLLKVPGLLLIFLLIKLKFKLAAKSLAIPLTEAQSPLLGVRPILNKKSF